MKTSETKTSLFDMTPEAKKGEALPDMKQKSTAKRKGSNMLPQTASDYMRVLLDADALASNADSKKAEAACKGFADKLPRFGINANAMRLGMFLAQASHESGGFARYSENLNYTTVDRLFAVFPRVLMLKGYNKGNAGKLLRNPKELAEAVYGGRKDLGNTEPGDGARFPGRGLFQITGRYNYTRAGEDIGIDLLANPELAADPYTSAWIAAGFWNRKGLNRHADNNAFVVVTQAVNPPCVGLAERQALYKRIKQALNS